MKTLEIKLPGSETQKTTIVPVKKSGGRGTLNLHDAVKGAAIAAIAGAWIVVYQSISIWLNKAPFDIIWMDVARAAVSGIIGFLSVNFFSQAKVVINAKELLP